MFKYDVARKAAATAREMACLSRSRDVTMGLSLPVWRHHYDAPSDAGKGRDASFFTVILTASLWGMCFVGNGVKGMRVCMRS